MKKAVLLLMLLMISGVLGAAPRRDLLTGKISEAQLAAMLLSRAQWHPFPSSSETDRWKALPESLRQSYLQEAEKLRKTSWEPLPATLFLEYARNGNRSRYEQVRSARRQKLAILAMAEILENRGRFLDDIANGIWAICEETYWGVPAHLGLQQKGPGLPDVTEPTVDLFAAETSSLLAWTIYLLEEPLKTVSPLLPERVYLEADRRILAPCLTRDDFWWMGFSSRQNLNNWTPWINSNWLTTALILEKDPAKRQKAVYKSMRSLDQFLNIYPADGGCDEGPGYWDRAGASLFDCLELLESATGGKINLYQMPLIRSIGQFIYKVYIKDDYFINFADASGQVHPEAELVYRFGKRLQDPVMTGFGAFLYQKEAVRSRDGVDRSGSLLRLLPALFVLDELRAAAPVEPLLGEFWLPDLQVMGARAVANSSRGFYLAAKGGHNNESHNHNDVGHFIVYADGRPLLIDVGVESYTAKTFSPQRYEIWTMQSAFHNLPTINGVMQKEGREYQASQVQFQAGPGKVVFSLDLAKAYPTPAQVQSWKRTLTLDREKSQVELAEEYLLHAMVKPFFLTLMTPLKVDVSAAGAIRLVNEGIGKKYVLTYAGDQFSARAEEITLADPQLKSVWGIRLSRILLESKSRQRAGQYKITLSAE
jgi:hypothetical protein